MFRVRSSSKIRGKVLSQCGNPDQKVCMRAPHQVWKQGVSMFGGNVRSEKVMGVGRTITLGVICLLSSIFFIDPHHCQGATSGYLCMTDSYYLFILNIFSEHTYPRSPTLRDAPTQTFYPGFLHGKQFFPRLLLDSAHTLASISNKSP